VLRVCGDNITKAKKFIEQKDFSHSPRKYFHHFKPWEIFIRKRCILVHYFISLFEIETYSEISCCFRRFRKNQLANRKYIILMSDTCRRQDCNLNTACTFDVFSLLIQSCCNYIMQRCKQRLYMKIEKEIHWYNFTLLYFTTKFSCIIRKLLWCYKNASVFLRSPRSNTNKWKQAHRPWGGAH
jgi:hypothetical protein